jgi:hypothetical protein
MPSDDRRISAILYLLGHDLSGRVRGETANSRDINSDPFGQMVPPALAEAGILGSAALFWLRHRAARRVKQLHQNVRAGAKAQELGTQRLQRDLEPYGYTVRGVEHYATKLGSTFLDSTVRTKHDHASFLAEIKVPTARYKRVQREKQESLGNVFLFRVDTKTGATEVFKVSPSTKSYVAGTGTPYRQWLSSFKRAARGK